MAVFLLFAGRLDAQTPWIHVEVTEEGAKQSKVRVNLPLSVALVALEVAPDEIISDGHFNIDHHGHHDISVPDLRRIWQELRDSGEAEFVSVEEEDETVTIVREGDLIRIDVTDRSSDESKSETVHVKVPIRVVDALLSGEGEELNLRAAVEELKSERGEIVRVEGPDENVRIWIDERNGK
jgi:hypothetical protein